MFILRFDSSEIALEYAGGKGLNLARLYNAGFNVPTGFILSTDAYRSFVEKNHLHGIIAGSLEGLDGDSGGGLEASSAKIRAAFNAGSMPADVQAALLDAYQELTQRSVAVRSSATTEDLPDLSFAGQQDTFLNIVGEDSLLTAVTGCWSSLWTPRAIGYRERNAIPHEGAAVAVIVQEMVQSETSGVIFTANPLSGLRSEIVIDATFGLGEALVSGQVEPDHFVFNTLSGEISQMTLGSKKIATRGLPSGGVESVSDRPSGLRTLDEMQINQLAELGQQVQTEFESPQDIEWAYTGGDLFVLQSRPITSLFPVPELSFNPLIAWFSFGSVQGLTGPMTPLGREAVQHVLTGAGTLFNLRIEPEESKTFVSAGERIWVRISDFIRNPIGNRIFERLMNYIEPSAVGILVPLTQDPRLGAGKGRIKVKTIHRLIGFFGPALVRAIRTFQHPHRARRRFDADIDAYLEALDPPTSTDRFELLRQTITLFREHIQGVFVFALPRFLPLFAPGMASLVLLNKLAGSRGELVLEITRGMPDNVTTQMDLAMWNVAEQIRSDKDSLQAFQQHSANNLAAVFLTGKLPSIAQQAVTDFFTDYGMRGVGEIDIGRRRWREDPTVVMQTLSSYLQLAPEAAPDVIFKRGEQIARVSIEKLVEIVSKRRAGWLKKRLVRAAAFRVRTLLGARESPKFFAIRVMGVIRAALLEAGEMFSEKGTIEAPEDLFYLTVAELEALSTGQTQNWREIIHERRAAFAHESRRRQVPRVLLSDGRAFYEGVGAESDSAADLSGSPVSPGVVEGIVHVVLNPQESSLSPGEILVCVGTDPAWTPLFLTASGLITEVGGMMTHGSVVAREYGIPAVVGVHEATTRLKNGQRIRLDGSTGKVTNLD